MNPEPPRMRLKIDVPPWLKEQLEQVAHSNQVDTSTSQLCAFLLAAAITQLERSPRLLQQLKAGQRPTRSLRFSFDLDIPEDWRPNETTDGNL